MVGNIWASSPDPVLNLEPATEQRVEELQLFAWARDAEAVLKTYGLGIKGVQ